MCVRNPVHVLIVLENKNNFGILCCVIFEQYVGLVYLPMLPVLVCYMIKHFKLKLGCIQFASQTNTFTLVRSFLNDGYAHIMCVAVSSSKV